MVGTAGDCILVVEDNPSVAWAFARAVRHLAEPVVAATVREGIDVLSGLLRCRAAILDLHLPDGSAVEIVEYARRADLSLPALVVSGDQDPSVAQAVRAAGAGFHLKPVGTAAIGRFVHRLRYPGPGEVWGLRDLIALGQRLNLHPSALRRRARVSETIRPDEFDALVSLRSPRGLPLSWSHFELLSKVRSRSKREAIARLVLAGDLGVRECAAMVHAGARERSRVES